MDTSALREFAFKKLQEARERGTELAAVTAARAASSISSSVPVSSSFVFRSPSSTAPQELSQPESLEQKLETLKASNDSLRAALTGSSSGPVDESIHKLDLINESLAFTIENVQGGSHAMKLLHRHMKDTAAMQNHKHQAFYRRRPKVG